MKKVNEILQNAKYIELIGELNLLEVNRTFCRHNMNHFLDVARISYIKILENNLNYSKAVVYAIALLHDMGRVLEYKDGIPHDEGSVIIAKEILEETSFDDEDKLIILTAIKNHRKETEDELSKIVYYSDKLSRNCFECKAEKECYWSKEKKNFIITY